MSTIWTPTREAAQTRLKLFLPNAGETYAQKRNFDLGENHHHDVSALSPWLRYRSILEENVIRETLAQHSASSAEKFIQEVFWRGYFKGWLEHRPVVWQRYEENLVSQINRLEKEGDFSARYENAISATTGIDCFDTWVNELISTGYLHNHARMWFASIWVYTLELPWELGADFFYRHLLDGDPASNTCSWRWVCGLHTKGKTYLAGASNIEKFTNARFNPDGQLASHAPALTEVALPDPVAITFESKSVSDKRYGLLITEEDVSVDALDLEKEPISILALSSSTNRSLLATAKKVENFTTALVVDGAKHAENKFGIKCKIQREEGWTGALTDWVSAHSLECIVTPRLPIGPVRNRLLKSTCHLDVPLVEITRPYDQAIWPHTKRGFFALKKKMDSIITELELLKNHGEQDGSVRN